MRSRRRRAPAPPEFESHRRRCRSAHRRRERPPFRQRRDGAPGGARAPMLAGSGRPSATTRTRQRCRPSAVTAMPNGVAAGINSATAAESSASSVGNRSIHARSAVVVMAASRPGTQWPTSCADAVDESGAARVTPATKSSAKRDMRPRYAGRGRPRKRVRQCCSCCCWNLAGLKTTFCTSIGRVRNAPPGQMSPVCDVT